MNSLILSCLFRASPLFVLPLEPVPDHLPTETIPLSSIVTNDRDSRVGVLPMGTDSAVGDARWYFQGGILKLRHELMHVDFFEVAESYVSRQI